MKTKLETAGAQAAAMTANNQERIWTMGIRSQEKDELRREKQEAQKAAEFWRGMFWSIGMPAVFAAVYLVYMTFPRG